MANAHPTNPAPRLRPWGLPGLVLGRRRTLVVDWRYQRRVAGAATALVGAGCLAFAGALYSETSAIHRAIASDATLAQALDAGLALPTMGFLAVGVAMCASVFLVFVLETHRTAGAAFALCRHLQALVDGRYGIRSELRVGDHLQDVKAVIDELGKSLQRRVELDAQALDALAERLEDAKDEPLEASELRDLARRMRDRLQG